MPQQNKIRTGNEKREKTEPPIWRTFSIFISSTFADMQAERDYLKNHVFRKIEDELRKRRIRLEIVDLRWGVDTTSIAQEDEREATVLKVCLDEIKRCQPFFIGLLGDRYGWVPPEERMKNALRGEDHIQPVKGKSVTALEIEFGVLSNPKKLSRSLFYFREPLPYDKFSPTKAAMFSDQYNPELSAAEKAARKTALAKLKTDIRAHFDKINQPKKVKSYPVEWDKSAATVTGLKAWGDMVYADIIAECEQHAAATWDQVPQNWLEQEAALLDAFVEQHTAGFCGREALLAEIKQHLLETHDKNGGMVLTGESGSGKSAVFAKIYQALRAEDCLVLAHSAGLSPRAKNVVDLLRLWNHQLSNFLGIEPEQQTDATEPLALPGMEKDALGQPTAPKLEIEKIQERFRELLVTAAEKNRVVLLVDALDRFEPTERARYMTWLPTVLPESVRLLVTAITGTETKAVEYHNSFFTKSLDHFTPTEARDTLTTLCNREHKDLQDRVEAAILAKKRDDDQLAAASPLWLTLTVNVLMALDRDDFEKMQTLEGRGDEQIETYMYQLVTAFPAQPGPLFLTLVEKAAAIFGHDFTWQVFNYLACSRNGLRERDLEQLISEGKDKNWDALRFAGLRRWFRGHLREAGEDLQWNLAHAILQNSLTEQLPADRYRLYHQALANHLLNLPAADVLRTTETMVHLMRAENADLGLDYYISDLTAAEKAGATTVLAQVISTEDNGLHWLLALLDASTAAPEKTWALANRFIYDLNDTLKIKGHLEKRRHLLAPLKTQLAKVDMANHGYDYATLHSKLGTIHQDMGHMPEALTFFDDAIKLFQELYEANPRNGVLKNGLAISYQFLGNIHQAMGHIPEALTFFEKFSELFEELNQANPRNDALKNGLAISYQLLGNIHQDMGLLPKALNFFEKCSKLIQYLHQANPRNKALKNELAISYEKLGAIHQAMGNFNKALEYFTHKLQLNKELYEANPNWEKNKNDLAISYQHLGNIHQAMGLMPEALTFFEKYNQFIQELYQANPRNEALKNGLAISYQFLGNIHQAMSRLPEALHSFEKRSQLSQELYEANPRNEALKNGLAISYQHLGNIHQAMGHMPEALTFFEKFSELFEELHQANPRNEKLKNGLAVSYSKLGAIHQAMGLLPEALKFFEKFSELGQELYQANSRNEELKKNLAISYGKLGDIHQAMGHLPIALNFFEKDLKLTEELYEANPRNESFKNGMAISYEKLGAIHQAMGNFNKALEYFTHKLQLNKELYEANPNWEKNKNDLAISYQHLGDLHQAMGHMPEALTFFEKDLKLTEELYESNPRNEALKNGLAISYQHLGNIHQAMGLLPEALKFFEKFSELGQALYQANSRNEELKKNLAISYQSLGNIHWAMGYLPEALKFFEKFSKLIQELDQANPQNIGLLEGLAISYYKLAMLHKAMHQDKPGQAYFTQWKQIISQLAVNVPQVSKYQQWNQVEY